MNNPFEQNGYGFVPGGTPEEIRAGGGENVGAGQSLFTDTIAAVSTPYGTGGVAVIRISGSHAFDCVRHIFTAKNRSFDDTVKPRYAYYGTVYDTVGDNTRFSVDDVILTCFSAPHSYTGEDTAEISCHGGILVTERVLEACFHAGARQALPGEFTRRAYANGRLTLEYAESLGNLLHAQNDDQYKLSRQGMNGRLTAEITELYETLYRVLAEMEAVIDFPEEDLTEKSPGELISMLSLVRTRLRELLKSYRTGHAIAEGVPTAICGKPNVGKSSLFNRLVGRDAAIVTDIPGTTRDLLCETVSLGRVTLRLFDTAGLRQTDDAVESIGVLRAQACMKDAELVLALFDATAPFTEQDVELCRELKSLPADRTVIAVSTKSDISSGAGFPADLPDDVTRVCLSAKTGDGLDELEAAVENAYINLSLCREIDRQEAAVIFSARQATAVSGALGYVDTAVSDMESGISFDICAEELHGAVSELAALCGKDPGDDILSDIFSRFCVGK